MARPIEYNKDDVMRRAMETFWRLGYQMTTMRDLVEATGLSTRSMYNLFESKNGLFQATLKWYYQEYLRDRYEKMMQESGTVAIRNFFLSATAFMESKGCFFVNTLADRHGIDQDCLAIADDHFHQLEVAFRQKLLQAQDREGYKGDVEVRTKQLGILFQGISVSSKNGDPARCKQKLVEDLLSQLGI